MDLDQRTRMLTSRGGRVILLGDGGEFNADSGEQDSEMFDQSDDEEKDLESQVRKGQSDAEDSDRNKREATPGPEASHPEPSNQQGVAKAANNGTGPGATPEEPKMSAATDGPAKDS